jgi:pSer/pThr/pTyr-binding forkhead associated (FHA) protein
MVRDLGSLNGTFVNNERITESPLAAGELLTVGTVTFRAVYEVIVDNGPPGGAADAASGATPERSEDPLARTVRGGPMEPIDLDGLDELGEDLEPAADSGSIATFISGPQAASGDKTDTYGENSDEIVVPKAAKAAKPAPATPPAAAAPAVPPTKSGEETTYIPGNEDTESETDDEEDDLNDFLSSLGK